jgi:peptide/nickel transport system permease protein
VTGGHPVLRRLLELVAVLLLSSFATFMLTSLTPGDPTVAILGKDRPQEQYEELRAELGLDQPVLRGYASWLGDAVSGDLGRSLGPSREPVLDKVRAALPVSLQLAAMALTLALVIAVPLALLSAANPGGRIDRFATAISFASISTPPFLAGLVLVLVFVETWPVFPRLEWVRLTSDEGFVENIRHAALPTIAVAMTVFPGFLRVLRSDLVETMQRDFILAARARGRPPWRVVVGDALRPSAFSLITLVGVQMGQLIGAAVVVEALFTLPGLGTSIARGALSGDVPLVQGGVLVIAVMYVLSNALIDIAYTRLDPRLRRPAR